MKLGDGDELIDAYNVLHGMHKPPESTQALYDYYMYMVGLSYDVIRACCKESITKIAISVADIKGKFKIKKSASSGMTPEQQIIVAAGLVRHGIAGVNESKKKSKGEAAKTIDLWEFVNASRMHLGLTREEALSLTMTEFNKLMEVKFPPEKNAADDITDEEYDDVMANLARVNKIRDAN